MHGEIDDEFTPKGARPSEHHHEEPQRPATTRYLDVSDVRPVDLGLLTDEGVGAQEDLVPRPWPDASDVGTERANAPRVAALLDHVPKPRGPQSWIVGQCLVDEIYIGIDQPRPGAWCGTHTVDHSQHATDHVFVDDQLRGDCAHLPTLGMEEPANLCFRLGGGGHREHPGGRINI